MPDCLRFGFLRRTDVAPCGKCPLCLADPTPELEPPEPVVDEKTQLRAEAEALGIVPDKRWGVKRLREEIEGRAHAQDRT